MKTGVFLGIISAVVGLMWTQPAAAIPTLQLDASPGTYDGTSETTIAGGSSFTLYALLNGLTPDAGSTYYVLAGVEGKLSSPASLGSFDFGGTTVDVTSDMTQGTPFGISPHGIYPTYYSEFAFSWNSANKFDNYDVSGVTGNHTGPTYDASGNALYMGFDVNASGLDPNTTLWFDLVEVGTSTKKGVTTTNIVNFAPFSHSVQSGGHTVPDGGTTALLLGAALTVMGLIRRKLT